MSNITFDWSKHTILVAEDEEINFLYLETLLLKTGAKILHAWNGQQALELVKKNPAVSLVLMDIKMPIMDGYKASREIKKYRPDLPIVAQTAYTLSDDKFRCLDAGCDDYLPKPIRKNLLYSIIDEQFSKKI